MAEESAEARLISKLASTRLIASDPDRTRIYDAAREACAKATTYFVISHTPEQFEDVFAVLADDQVVVVFELPRDGSTSSPLNVVTYAVHDYQKRLRGRAAKDFKLILKLACQG